MSDTWTIGELAERAADLLGQDRHAHGQEPRDDGPEPRVDGPEPRVNGPEPRVNGRVREVPNERLIRWYTTIGLLDPPLGRRGRVALYGRRHLLQLVAVKRRQADGLSIAAIQAELTGATDAMLQRVAGLTGPPPGPPHGPPPRPLVPPPPRGPAAPATANVANHAPGAPDIATPPAPDRCGTRPETGTAPAIPDVARPTARDRFWARPASSAATADSGHFATANRDTTHGDIARSEAVPAHTVFPDVVHGVRLAPGVTVLLDPAHRVPDGHDVAALRRAAAPLLTALATLGLAGPFDGAHDTHDASALDPHASDTLER
ncbi:helix-turn-helix domain-containing protein [Microbispora sp. KK1-11]|uniref:helix-turn-helix domain-containing protein n=1 Tax=Microbispora sp. KK1-11 TaxID=2053005 RepID=UPI0021B03695|nr:helix-turn-helix domain-containing protein [Microbispora sp. KK1-11]